MGGGGGGVQSLSLAIFVAILCDILDILSY